MQALFLAWTKVFGHPGVAAGPVVISSYEQKTSFRAQLCQKWTDLGGSAVRLPLITLKMACHLVLPQA